MKNSFEEFEKVEIEKVDNSQQAYAACSKFTATLQRDFPDKYYPGISAEADQGFKENSFCKTYSAKIRGNVVGLLFGTDGDGNLHGDFLLVHPRFQRLGIAQKLLNAAKSDYRSLHIIAASFGEDRRASGQEVLSRQAALIQYYGNQGFTLAVDESGQSGSPTDLQVDMVWHRDKNELRQ